jgi:DNA damage-inducible protein 1
MCGNPLLSSINLLPPPEPDPVEENFLKAEELIPASFITPPMIYVQGNINGFNVPLLLDTGAQISCMSLETAEKLGLGDLIDVRVQGKAFGVGAQPIVGKIHALELLIGSRSADSDTLDFSTAVSLLCPCSILKKFGKMIILGLDLFYLHQVKLNFETRCLEIGDKPLPFLSPKQVASLI